MSTIYKPPSASDRRAVEHLMGETATEPGAPVGEIIVALLIPIVGIVIAIVLLAKGRGAHGGAVLLASVAGWIVCAMALASL